MSIKISNVRNPQYNRVGTVDVLVTVEGIGEVPFTATPHDPELHGREIYSNAIAGMYGEIKPYTKLDELPETDTQALVRKKRNALLSKTDWTQLPDVPESTKNKWAEYRQLLRDIPQQPNFPHEVIWPEQP